MVGKDFLEFDSEFLDGDTEASESGLDVFGFVVLQR